MHGGANVRCPYIIGLRGLRDCHSQPCHKWMRILRSVIVICWIVHPVRRNSLHGGLCGHWSEHLRRVIRLLNPHELRSVRRAGGLLLLRHNVRRRHLPVQLKRMRVPKDALHFRGGLLKLCLLLLLQRMLHLRISVAVRVLRVKRDKWKLHPIQRRDLPRRFRGRRVVVVLHRRRSMRCLLGVRRLQRRLGLCLLRHVRDERLVQVGQLHLEQLLRAQCGCVNRGGLRQPGHVRLLHVFGLRKVR